MAKIKKIPKLKKLSKGRRKRALRFDFEVGGKETAVYDEKVRALARRFANLPGAIEVAKGAMRYQSQLPDSTIPEAIAYYFLDTRDVIFFYQSSHLGGRSALGGLVPDFVVASGGGRGYVWLIQGDYWHGKHEVIAHDRTALRNLKDVTISGVEILDVVEIWESDIYLHYPRVFELALDGIGMRHSRIF